MLLLRFLFLFIVLLLLLVLLVSLDFLFFVLFLDFRYDTECEGLLGCLLLASLLSLLDLLGSQGAGFFCVFSS